MILPLKIAAAIVVLGLLIFIHETGHFLVAKAFGVRVITYSFGFGRRLVGITRGRTDYRISAFPFGGYVRLWGADPFEIEERGAPPRGAGRGDWALQDVPVWQRLAIYAAGPLANLVVPFFVFWVLLMAGEPQLATMVGTVVRGSPAAAAGVQPGDRVVAVAGRPVTAWGDLTEAWDAAVARGGPIALTVQRAERTVALQLIQESGAVEGEGGPGEWGLRVEVPSAEVGVIHSASPAGRAGMRTGDRLVAVGGRPVTAWPDARALLERAGERVALRWEHDGAAREAEVAADIAWVPEGARAFLTDVAVDRWGLQPASLFVEQVSEGSASARAGIAHGDFLLALDGQRLGSWHEVLAGVASTMESRGEARVARPVSLVVIHEDTPLTLALTPEVMRDTDALGRYYWRPVLGITRLGSWADSPTVRVYYSPGRALAQAATETGLLVRFTVTQIVRIVTGEVAIEKSVGGPVEIMRQATEAAERGLFDVARLLGIISISVGIFNLLPVPVLDGGNLIFYTLEAVRGRPVSALLRERAQIVGVMLLVALMIFALVNDFKRLLGG